MPDRPLHQYVAISATARKTGDGLRTRTYQALQKPADFDGHQRTYTPLDADDPKAEKLPPDIKLVKLHVQDVLQQFCDESVKVSDLVATVDNGNTLARADIVLDGVVLAERVPATHLLYLEARLKELQTVVGAVPTLDPAQVWERNESSGLYTTAPEVTHRNKKHTRGVVLAEATKEHPAQVKAVEDDVPVGTYTKYNLSAAIREDEKRDMLRRVADLLAAVQQARQMANSTAVPEVHLARKLYDYVLKG